MKKKAGIILLTGAYILLLLAMFILPLCDSYDHSITRNTLSYLAGQSHPGSWIMNSIFATLAISSVISGWGYYEGFAFHRIIMLLFGISLILAAIINQTHLTCKVLYYVSENGWHLYFISTAWLTFIILSFSTSLVLEKPSDRLIAIFTGISVILLSILVSEADRTAGIWQRLLFIISFGWMIYTFKPRD
jgi:hypothetical protein